ncbi:MAG TPA: aspartate kinase, partial [bacterium]|nr:aspartate kinase [bacterium]
GYTKGTEGIMREFDRGYTEVTFSKIALDVNAGEAIIHKEYHLCSADPNIVGVDNAFPVCFTNYDVADQLADIWMEAIHPKVSKALELGNINLRVKNTFDPDHPGTLISKNYKAENSKVELVSGTDCVIVIEIHDPSMVGEVAFDLKIMELFKKNNTSYILKATNANSISMVIWERTDNDNLIEDLKREFLIVTVKKVAVVCVMGSNIDEPSILAKTVRVFSENNIQIYCLSLTLRRVNIQFAIERDSFEKAIIALNKVFFLDI